MDASHAVALSLQQEATDDAMRRRLDALEALEVKPGMELHALEAEGATEGGVGGGREEPCRK